MTILNKQPLIKGLCSEKFWNKGVFRNKFRNS